MKHLTSHDTGLTLIEVLVALAIFTVISAAVLGMFPTVFKINGQTRADQAVTIGAKQFMEDVRGQMGTTSGFDAVTQASQLPAVPAADKVDNYACERQLNTQPDSTVPNNNIKRVTLTCTRTGFATQTFSLDLGRP